MTKEIAIIFAVMVAFAGCRYAPKDNAKATVSRISDRIATLGTPYPSAPYKTEVLCEFGNLSLVAGETEPDMAVNKLRQEGDSYYRNSLFVKLRKAGGTVEWRLLLTSGSNWRNAADMGSWCLDRAKDVNDCFYVFKASFSFDGRHLWLVCNPHTGTYSVVCSYDVYDNTFRVLTDGYTADEQPDGTILVEGKKFYPNDDLGAAWRDVWLTPDGKIVRKGEITLRGADL